MMVWMGVYTQTFLPHISETNARILDQSRMNVPLRVSLPGSIAVSHGGLGHAR
jgi:hypothetical protein